MEIVDSLIVIFCSVEVFLFFNLYDGIFESFCRLNLSSDQKKIKTNTKVFALRKKTQIKKFSNILCKYLTFADDKKKQLGDIPNERDVVMPVTVVLNVKIEKLIFIKTIGPVSYISFFL